MPEQDEELERLMLDILTIAGSVQYEEPTKAARRVRAFAQRLFARAAGGDQRGIG